MSAALDRVSRLWRPCLCKSIVRSSNRLSVVQKHVFLYSFASLHAPMRSLNFPQVDSSSETRSFFVRDHLHVPYRRADHVHTVCRTLLFIYNKFSLETFVMTLSTFTPFSLDFNKFKPRSQSYTWCRGCFQSAIQPQDGKGCRPCAPAPRPWSCHLWGAKPLLFKRSCRAFRLMWSGAIVRRRAGECRGQGGVCVRACERLRAQPCSWRGGGTAFKGPLGQTFGCPWLWYSRRGRSAEGPTTGPPHPPDKSWCRFDRCEFCGFCAQSLETCRVRNLTFAESQSAFSIPCRCHWRVNKRQAKGRATVPGRTGGGCAGGAAWGPLCCTCEFWHNKLTQSAYSGAPVERSRVWIFAAALSSNWQEIERVKA